MKGVDDLSKKQAYKKFSYRGLDITKLISLTPDEVSQHFCGVEQGSLFSFTFLN